MRAVDVITKKRGSKETGGGNLSKEEIEYIVQGYAKGDIPDYQMAAFLMAVFFNGMTACETGFLTGAMLSSGEVIDLRHLGLHGSFVDKHSTGGVGDKVSLPLAAVAAAVGVKVPMMSGRALGITGGTLDKLEAIAGYNVNLTAKQVAQTIEHCGFAMFSQSQSIVPADKKMYALRDVTGTVESIPLITASILSKKVAEGSDALVFDVKVGSGAFMKTHKQAKDLATSLVKTAGQLGKPSCALITRMDWPLGRKVGNFLEVEESLECLQGKGSADVMELVYAFASRMALFAGLYKTNEDALLACRDAVLSGKALSLFLENVRLQGGDADKLMHEMGLRRAAFSQSLTADHDGFIAIDAGGIGEVCVMLGVGRAVVTDSVDDEAGVVFKRAHGEAVSKGDLILTAYSSTQSKIEAAWPQLLKAVSILPCPPDAAPLIVDTITDDNIKETQ